MTPVANTPLPQTISPAKTQAENPNGPQTADGQGSESFAQVLSRSVDSKDSTAGKDSAAKSDAASKDAPMADNTAQTATPVAPANPLAAILSQIPVEARGTAATPLSPGGNPTESATTALAGLARATATSIATSDGGKSPAKTNAKGESTATALMTDGAAAAHSNGKPAVDAKTIQPDDFSATLKAAGDKLAIGQRLSSDTPRSDRPAEQLNLLASQQAALAQQASPTSNQNTAPTASQTIPTPLGTPAWGDDFSQKINWLVSQKSQVAELHLNPPNLGPLDVSLKIADNQATVLFTSPHATVREAVENALPKLRDLLADNGIMLSNASVGDQAPRERHSNEFTGQKANGASPSGSIQDGGEPAATLRTTTIRHHNGVLDTFA